MTAVTLTPGAPADVGIDAEQLERAAGLLTGHVAAGDISAASLFVARRGVSVMSRGFGRLRPEARAPAVDGDSIFLLASSATATQTRTCEIRIL